MQVSVSKTGGLEHRLTVEVPEDQITAEIRNRLQSLSRTARIDGFRPGKAPLKIVEQRYASRVREEVIGEVMRRSFADAVIKEQLRPAGAPIIDPVASEPGKGLSFTATFEVYPEVSMKPVSELKVTKSTCEITEADVDRMIEQLRTQRRRFDAVERAAAKGDQVLIDFVGRVDDKEFPGGAATDFELELGSGRFIPGFEDGLIGKAPGSYDVAVQFPADYPHQELAGKPAVFGVTLKAVRAPVLPELDAGFFQQFGVDDGELATFRKEVRANMERERDRALQSRRKHGTFNALIDANPMAVPKSLVENEARRLLQQTQQGLMMRGVPRAQVEGMSIQSFREQAERRVLLGLLIGDIIQKQKLEADPVRVRSMLEQLAASYDDPSAVVKWYYEDNERLNEIRTAVLEDDVVDWLLTQASVTEQSVSFDDLMNPRQTSDEPKATA
jgi:trigger factor